ncbi:MULTISPECIES: amino acid--[acyl-carrier-protein] ligase [Rhizobium/Agrobacterium group]|uniref:amino acid--[acyl-carrier-protein] ligase n=1 Tax=Rhizobium/Agrobacterium group TaxID=227290 RepID=UPI0008DC192D|nr:MULTISPECIES: amino acid--[acyl-carrier-protein] ligase [Rhizobium/Agrobacterium group]MCF1436372.1 amino acid--[acyl-carrier-protein] ligase [Allorhizobium ampelinum]MCF1485004.1 amino acid--[acyl-carrier-protein] ligase [Allorhizobium ampelinum]MUO91096.1 amino acid--[acyl-carrier-protein] ligase [Agrobacterium vitis]MUZ54941.1 amino acid--[acyl-carrier-protein] ligase [Agrobacterium vitis]MUZ93968.1 amino acid--[acyl-carrier-protein] ligase [Agrobacterium vitis]
MDSQTNFLDRLFEAGLLIDTGVDGLYGRSGQFEDVIAAFERLIDRFGGADGAEALRFPPGMNRAYFETSGYMKSFPQLAGTVHSFCGNELDHVSLLKCMDADEDWTKDQKATDIVLTPAACYPLYPTIAKRGPIAASGALFDLQSYCFRHEPSTDPARQQLFRMREYVCMGSESHVTDFRQTWMDRGLKMMEEVALPVEIDIANDPFFGRAGKMLANNQRDQNLKFELLIPITSVAKPTACMSFNYHQDAFGSKWGLNLEDGSVAHTACVGFGLERIALALFHHHGLDVKAWPQSVRTALWG